MESGPPGSKSSSDTVLYLPHRRHLSLGPWPPPLPPKPDWGGLFLTLSVGSLRALEVPMTLSNKLRFYLRSSRKTEVRPQEVPLNSPEDVGMRENGREQSF